MSGAPFIASLFHAMSGYRSRQRTTVFVLALRRERGASAPRKNPINSEGFSPGGQLSTRTPFRVTTNNLRSCPPANSPGVY